MIQNQINDKIYIGLSVDIEKRWITHKNQYNNSSSKEFYKLLYIAMRKYGIENFKFSVVELCQKE